MDITKNDSMSISRVAQISEMPGSYSEQFVGSPPNKSEIIRVQNTSKASNSPMHEDEKAHNMPKKEGSSLLRDGDNENLGNSNGASASPILKSASSNASSLNKMNSQTSSSTGIKDEKDIKKEDPSLSPQNLSPLDFVSGGIGQSRCDKDIKAESTFNNSSTPSPLTFDKSASFFRSSTCNDVEPQRSSSVGSATSANNASQLDTGGILNNSMSPKMKTEDFGCNASNNARNLFPFNCNLPKHSQNAAMPQTEAVNNEPSDYMQQRNHVFVFSTQLANKSAESVIGGQFPTIIAYHCMQPSTKMFLEDFFKNSAKTTKLQRQYSLNIMNLMQTGGSPRPGTPPSWLNDCNNMGRFAQRIGMRNSGGGTKPNRAGEQSQLVSDLQTPLSSNLSDSSSNTESLSTKASIAAIKCEDDMTNMQSSSLQGVKIPDENLTPQQRQHREEQLAKLKKMNSFLFPEMDGGGDFHPSQFSAISGQPEVRPSIGHCSETGAGKLYIPGNSTKPSASSRMCSNLDAGKGLATTTDGLTSMRLMQSIKQECGIRTSNQSDICDTNMNSVKGRRPSDMLQDKNSADIASCPDMAHYNPSSDMLLSQAEWSKFHNSGLSDDFKSRHGGNNASDTVGCHTNASLSRSLSTGVAGYAIQSRPNTGPSPINRNNNGPPPSYHQAQRSASVPIAMKSPNHASPHSTDMSLLSPQTSRMTFDMASTPPIAEVANPTSSASTALAALTGTNSKNVFSRDLANTNSPAPTYSSSSLVSPREFDFAEAAHKTKRSSPQKSKSPSSLQNVTDMESKYKSFGLNYSTCNMPPQNLRQNIQQMPSQFCRRIDNIPLNPNCNRIGQNKTTTNSFDPIASLAQMSQQLGAVGSMSNSSSAGGLNLLDMNAEELMAGPPAGRVGDSALAHYNHINTTGGPGGRVMGQFSTDINHMLCGENASMNQRMMHGKMCGNFAPNTTLAGLELRDSFPGCNDMLSSRGVMYRRGMPNNFDHFNMSPNVHVRASAPNTIQYMPAKTPHMNNMRMPASSAELFQRYANPQAMGTVGVVGHQSGPISNNVNANVMNMFGNCDEISTGHLRGNELDIEGHLIPNNDYMNVP